MKNLLEIINYDLIIAQIKESRKGADMIMIFICLCCAAIDYILRKNGMIEDWFTQSYLIIGFFSTCIWAVKTFNAIADRIDAKKEEKETKKIRENELQERLIVCKPIIDNFSETQKDILKTFILQESLKTTLCTEDESINNEISSINSFIYMPYHFHIEHTNLGKFLILSIERNFYLLLKEYFKNN